MLLESLSHISPGICRGSDGVRSLLVLEAGLAVALSRPGMQTPRHHTSQGLSSTDVERRPGCHQEQDELIFPEPLSYSRAIKPTLILARETGSCSYWLKKWLDLEERP